MEEAPSIQVKVVEEDIHLGGGDHICEQGEVPVSCEDLNIHTDVLQVVKQFGQVQLHQVSNQGTVLDVARQSIHVDVTHLIVLNQGHKKPERHLL